MDLGSVLSEPVHYPHSRGFPKERSVSMTIISPKTGQPRMSQLENLEAKMANIEVSLSSVNGGRRRKGTSLGGGTISARSSPRPPPTPQPIESKELRTALQDREAVIQNLRNVLCLGKLPRPTGPPLDDTERPAAEQKLQRLKIESENKKIAIRNIKSALDKLDITDNIDIRIRQAELEYALGREELQLLSIVEEVRALQTRLDKSKPESNSLYSILTSGVNLCLHAVQATTGRWAANTKSDSLGLFIEWALDGEGLYRGDRILEINGKLITCRTKDELQKLIGTIGKCQLVVIRKKSSAIQHQQLAQQQEDNQRLQHRISYLEEQVCELLQTQTVITKESTPPSPAPPPKLQNNQHRISPINNNGNNCGNGSSGHVTSISISSASSSPSDKPEIFQRGNYVTTLVGGKPIELTGNNINNNSTAIKHTKSNNIINSNNNSKSHITKTIIKENGNHTDGENNNYAISKSLSASKISINSDLLLSSSNHKRRTADRAARNHNKLHSESTNHQYQQLNSQGIYHNGSSGGHHRNNNNMHARSVEHLNYNGVDRRTTSKFDVLRNNNEQIRKFGNDLRSVKSLDFESDNDNHQYHHHHHHHNGHHHNGHIKQQNGHSNHHNHYNNYNDQQKRNTDYTSEPVAPRIRPTPPKKPLRLSLQRAQSLQTVELLPSDAEKKRSLKRLHHSDKSNHESALIENCSPLLTASLGRHKHI